MAIDTNDPRVSKEGQRILVDDIPVRKWVDEMGIYYGTFSCLKSQGMSVSDIEAKFKDRKRAKSKKRTVQYLGKEWTIKELHREHCRKDITTTALRNRILTRHWDIHLALTQPPRQKRGYEVEYKGKIYDSISKLCSIIGVCEYQVHELMRGGVSLERAIERVSDVDVPTVLYKGQHVRIIDLVNHPDNVHKVDYAVIVGRIRTLNYTPEEALAIPKKKIKVRSFTYKGKEYDSKKDLVLALNLKYSDYLKLNGLDPDTPEFFEALEKLSSQQ